METAAHEAVNRAVKLVASDDRTALVRCLQTGRECFIPLASADLSPAGELTVPTAVAREAGLL